MFEICLKKQLSTKIVNSYLKNTIENLIKNSFITTFFFLY